MIGIKSIVLAAGLAMLSVGAAQAALAAPAAEPVAAAPATPAAAVPHDPMLAVDGAPAMAIVPQAGPPV